MSPAFLSYYVVLLYLHTHTHSYRYIWHKIRYNMYFFSNSESCGPLGKYQWKNRSSSSKFLSKEPTSRCCVFFKKRRGRNIMAIWMKPGKITCIYPEAEEVAVTFEATGHVEIIPSFSSTQIIENERKVDCLSPRRGCAIRSRTWPSYSYLLHKMMMIKAYVRYIHTHTRGNKCELRKFNTNLA